MSGPLDDLGFEEYRPPGSGGGPLDDLGFEPVEAAPAPAPAEPEPIDPMEMLAQLGGMEPGGGRDYQTPAVQKAQQDVAGPSLWQAAKTIGPMMLPGGQGLGFLGKTAVNAAGSGLSSGAITALEDGRWQSDPEAAALAMLASAGTGAATGGAVSGLMSGAEGLLDLGKRGAQYVARRAQSAAEGLSGPTFRNIAKTHGLDYARDELAQAAIDTAPKHYIPRDTDWYRTQRAGQQAAEGARYGAAIKQLDADVPNAIGLDDFTRRMDDHGDQYLIAEIAEEERAKKGLVDNLRNTIASKYGTGQVGNVSLKPSELQAEKVAMTKRGYPDNATMSVSDADRAEAYRAASSVPRQALDDAAAQAPPATQAEYLTSKERFGIADTLADATERKAVMDESRTGIWNTLTGPIRDRMPDAMSLASQAFGKGAGYLENLAAVEGQAAARLGGSMAGDAVGQRERQKQELERASNASMGHNLEGVVSQAIDEAPDMLGPYESRFLEARGSKDPMAVTTLLHQLQSDDQWRTRYLPRLKAATNRSGEF